MAARSDRAYSMVAILLSRDEQEVRSPRFEWEPMPGEWDEWARTYENDENCDDGYGYVYLTGGELLDRVENLLKDDPEIDIKSLTNKIKENGTGNDTKLYRRAKVYQAQDA